MPIGGDFDVGFGTQRVAKPPDGGLLARGFDARWFLELKEVSSIEYLLPNLSLQHLDSKVGPSVRIDR